MNIDQLLSEHNLSEFKDLFTQAQPSLRLTFSVDKSEKGFSRAGGRPHLPMGFQWPRSRAKVPLAFLCQVDLSDKEFRAFEELPQHGILSFFYDAFDGPWGNRGEDHFGWRVFYFDDPQVLKHTDFPAELPAASRFSSCAVAIADELSYPAITVEMAAGSESGHDGFESYLQVSEEIYGSTVVNRMFGHAQDIAGDFRLDCEIASRDLELDDNFDFASKAGEELALASEEWVLLLQLDSDAHAQMMWVDSGRLYLAIRKGDLLARKFEKVWMICETQ